jgi:8-hydroxy-5-deazaflavin:NADPH oxidoreductase
MAVAASELTAPAARATIPEIDDLRLGIVGAGKFGTTLARAAIEAGYDVAISGSGPAARIELTVDVLVPGAHAATTDQVVRHADLIVLAVPTHRFRELPRDLFAGKIVIDAMNYWQPVDGDDPELSTPTDGTSAIVQERFPSARVVKSLNQLGYHQLEENQRPRGAPDRIAIGAAGDDRLAVRKVMRLLDRLGFDPVDAGPLKNGLALEPDGSPVATTYSADQLAKLISQNAGQRIEVNAHGAQAEGRQVAGTRKPGHDGRWPATTSPSPHQIIDSHLGARIGNLQGPRKPGPPLKG